MATEKKDELDPRFKNLPVSVLMDMFASVSTPEEIRHQIKVFIVGLVESKLQES